MITIEIFIPLLIIINLNLIRTSNEINFTKCIQPKIATKDFASEVRANSCPSKGMDQPVNFRITTRNFMIINYNKKNLGGLIKIKRKA